MRSSRARPHGTAPCPVLTARPWSPQHRRRCWARSCCCRTQDRGLKTACSAYSAAEERTATRWGSTAGGSGRAAETHGATCTAGHCHLAPQEQGLERDPQRSRERADGEPQPPARCPPVTRSSPHSPRARSGTTVKSMVASLGSSSFVDCPSQGSVPSQGMAPKRKAVAVDDTG